MAQTYQEVKKSEIGIARALYKDFDILIMDEATNEFDINSEEIILQKIYSKHIQTKL